MTAQLLALLLACGTERWDVKTLADAEAASIDTKAVEATVSQLSKLPAAEWANDAPRHEGPEFTTYVLKAFVVAWKLEEDGDLHIVIADAPKGPTMVVEIPDPSCMADNGSRKDFLAMVGLAPSRKLRRLKRPFRALLTGVGFFDRPHGQQGLAPNGIELHPLLEIAAIGAER